MRSWVCVLLLAIAAPAHADDEARARAVALFDDGKADYDANRFGAAIEKFKQAYALSPDPVYLFNIAQAYRNAADCEEGHAYYTRYLDADPSAANADSVRGWLRELEPCVARIKQLREQPKAETPAPTPAPVIVSASGERVVDRGGTMRTIGLLTAGAGALGLVAGVVYGVKSQGYENEIATACAQGCTWEQLQAKHDAGERANTLSLVGYIAGGVALGVGVGLYIYGTTKVERISVTPAPGGATASVSLSF